MKDSKDIKDRINFEIEKDLKSRAEEIARSRDLSLSQYCRRLIRESVEAASDKQPELELTGAR